MSHDETSGPDRRTFLQTGALATAAALSAAPGARAQEAAPEKAKVLPTRKLGRTGLDVTLLELGSGGLREKSTLDRMLRLAFAAGVRTFDTAKAYGTEPGFKAWFERSPEVRKQITLVTKDGPKTAKDMIPMLDQRLEAIGTDYVDLFFVHGLGDDQKSTDEAINLVTSPEFKETAEAIKKSGKAKFVGFSIHHPNRAPIIEAAAKAGFIDAIMVMYTPTGWVKDDEPIHRALDVAHKAGVGLISMKQVAAGFPRGPKINILDEVVKRVPVLQEKGLKPYQGLLHAIWTDERISASCVSLKTTDQVREGADAARRFEPLKAADIRALGEAVIASNPTMCGNCDGRCSVAAGTKAELGNLTRFYTYHEHHGERTEARRQYAALSPEARDWTGADLDAAREACPSKLNFAELLPKTDDLLS